jgi:hypothetical protein
VQLTKEDLLVLTNPLIAAMVLAASVVTLGVLAIVLPVQCVWKVAEQLRGN